MPWRPMTSPKWLVIYKLIYEYHKFIPILSCVTVDKIATFRVWNSYRAHNFVGHWIVVVAILVCSRSDLWPIRFVAVSFCGRFGMWPFRLWPFRFVAVSFCGRSSLWPFWPETKVSMLILNGRFGGNATLLEFTSPTSLSLLETFPQHTHRHLFIIESSCIILV